ncbi:DUF3515 family protein [Planococcus sp. APC 4015]|nr:DUF3515 family protein [Planococcus sp. APC 4015]
MRAPRFLVLTAAALTLAASLAGCSTTVALQPAEDADNPTCADIMVRLPGSIDGEDRRWTDAQATGAWGDPTAVILACGVTPPGPTEARCITLGGVDWIVDESRSPQYLVTSYGRTPAVEVLIDNEVVSSNNVLESLGPLVAGWTTVQSACVESDTVLPDAG